MKHLLLTIIILSAITIGTADAQPASFRTSEPFETQYILGINFVPEWQVSHRTLMGGRSYRTFSPNAGVSFEARITRHSGVETGLYYRNVKYPAGKPLDPQGTAYAAEYHRYLSIPLVYRYYSRIVNAAIGVNYDQLLTSAGQGNRVGLVLKVSKDITLYKGLFLEPEFHFNPFWEDDGVNYSWVGLAIGLKYRF